MSNVKDFVYPNVITLLTNTDPTDEMLDAIQEHYRGACLIRVVKTNHQTYTEFEQNVLSSGGEVVVNDKSEWVNRLAKYAYFVALTKTDDHWLAVDSFDLR